MATKRILFTGGGSGGHVYPIVAVIEAIASLTANDSDTIEFSYIGPRDSFTTVFEQHGVRMYALVGAKLRRYVSIENIIDVPKFILSVVQAFVRVWLIMPDVIFSKGGTGALPVVFAGWVYRIPIFIHESDTVPGLVSRITSRFAHRIAVSFDEARSYFNPSITVWTGHPMRSSAAPRADLTPARAKQDLGCVAGEPLVVVLGGSQGSRRLNEAVLASLTDLLVIAQVLHQTGPAEYDDVAKLAATATNELAPELYARHPYRAMPYIENMGLVLAAADLVVTRAGSSSIFELAAFGKPAILIPLFEAANDHQLQNAVTFAHRGGGIVIEEPNLTPHLLVRQIHDVLTNPTRYEQMSRASAAIARPGAAETIAAELLRLA